MIRLKLLSLFIFTSSLLFSQSIISSSAGTIIGFNYEESELWKYKIKTTPSVGVYLYLNYEYRFTKPYFIRVKLGIAQHYSQFTINNSTIEGYNYTFDFPLLIGYHLDNKFDFELGASIQDYREREDFAMIKSYNMRVNFVAGILYRFNSKWAIEFVFSRMLSEKVDAFVIKNYTDHFRLGIKYSIYSFKKNTK